jgi:hypothetical protein
MKTIEVVVFVIIVNTIVIFIPFKFVQYRQRNFSFIIQQQPLFFTIFVLLGYYLRIIGLNALSACNSWKMKNER